MGDEDIPTVNKKVNVEVDLDKWIPTKTSTLLQIIVVLLGLQLLVALV